MDEGSLVLENAVHKCGFNAILAHFYLKVLFVLAFLSMCSSLDMIQSQEVAKAYGAVCTPDIFLFKKVYSTIL